MLWYIYNELNVHDKIETKMFQKSTIKIYIQALQNTYNNTHEIYYITL